MHRLDWISDIQMNRWEHGFDYYVIGVSTAIKWRSCLCGVIGRRVKRNDLAVPASEGACPQRASSIKIGYHILLATALIAAASTLKRSYDRYA
jgi:hypothetical protein